MTGKRLRYSAELKVKVALDTISGELTIAQLAIKHGIHQAMITAWRTQAIEGMAGVFSGNAEAAEAMRDSEIDQLMPNSVGWSWSGILCDEPPIDERWVGIWRR